MLLGGTIGYMVTEGWPFIDALYMTVITLSTVGYSEVRGLSSTGRIFTMVLIILGVGFVFYLAGSIIQFMVEGRIREILGRRKLKKKIRVQKGHYIICGYGRVGSSICEALASKPLNIVVIERDPARIAKLNERNILHVPGEATDEENLIRAGVERARGLVAALKTDSDNVYVTLSARQLNPDLFIMARAGEEHSERKLLAAGANKVLCPYRMGAHRMAQTILRPTVTDFVELTLMDTSRNIQMEEMPVHPSSRLIDVALQDSGIRKDLDLIIVAVKKAAGDMLFNPSSQTKLGAGDTVIAIGEKKNLEKLERLLNPGRQIL
ncbi:MAG: potassium channel protein [Deltaproteobacteria bacterium]|nr:potassium channel protein [Deltaproteobacteria bacterium]MBW2075419.1 potassium channel protein [Deltaproteobacteria bacterium]